METLRTAVIGAGMMGRNHVRVYSELRGSELVAVVDVDFSKAKEVADKYGCNAYRDFEEMLRKEKPDAVSVVVPTKLHADVGCKVLEQTNALVEKPIADTMENARKLVDKAEESGNILMIGHIERFNPAVEYLKDWVEKKKARYLAFNIVRVGVPAPRAGITTGVVVDLGIHDIDIVRYLTGENVLEVRAKTMELLGRGVEDHAQIWMSLENCSASIVTNWVSPRKIRHMYVTLDKAFIHLNYITQTLEIYTNEEEPDPRLLWHPAKIIELKFEEPLKRELAHFLDCVRKNAEPLVTGEDAMESLRVALEAEGCTG